MKFVSKFLTNKTVLMVVTALAFFNVIGYIVIGNIHYAVYFALIALVARYFSGNMIIVLGVPLLVVNLMASGYKEGLEDQEKIDKLVEERKKKEKLDMPVMFPINDVLNSDANDANGDAVDNVESFQNQAKDFVGAEMDEAYNDSTGINSEDSMRVLNQLKLLEDTKRGGRIIEKLTHMSNKMKGLAPLHM